MTEQGTLHKSWVPFPWIVEDSTASHPRPSWRSTPCLQFAKDVAMTPHAEFCELTDHGGLRADRCAHTLGGMGRSVCGGSRWPSACRPATCGRIPVHVRHVCVDLLHAGWGVAMCRMVVSFTRVYRVGVWFGFVRFALLLAVVLCWVDRCFDSWVLLGLLCLLRVTPIATRDDSSLTPTSNHRAEFGNGNLANPGPARRTGSRTAVLT